MARRDRETQSGTELLERLEPSGGHGRTRESADSFISAGQSGLIFMWRSPHPH